MTLKLSRRSRGPADRPMTGTVILYQSDTARRDGEESFGGRLVKEDL